MKIILFVLLIIAIRTYGNDFDRCNKMADKVKSYGATKFHNVLYLNKISCASDKTAYDDVVIPVKGFEKASKEDQREILNEYRSKIKEDLCPTFTNTWEYLDEYVVIVDDLNNNSVDLIRLSKKYCKSL